jgi:hypothetical protein
LTAAGTTKGPGGRPARCTWLNAAALGVAVGLLATCAALPVRREHLVRLSFEPPDQTDYAVAELDSAAVYRRDGLTVTVRHLTKQALNAEYPEESAARINVNPFTYGTRIDNDLGYAPDRFTVFEIDINNIGLAKVAFQPLLTRMHTGRGDRLEPWVARKADGADSFEQYYRARRGVGGNDQDWFRTRMGIVTRELCCETVPIFKGQRHTCKLVFDTLHPGVYQLLLELRNFVMSYRADGLPGDVVDLSFPFAVQILLDGNVDDK